MDSDKHANRQTGQEYCYVPAPLDKYRPSCLERYLAIIYLRFALPSFQADSRVATNFGTGEVSKRSNLCITVSRTSRVSTSAYVSMDCLYGVPDVCMNSAYVSLHFCHGFLSVCLAAPICDPPRR